jgi:YesN/AraC family two-component response regulator
MKIIEGLKQIKDLTRKADDLRSKIAQFCADMDIEVPAYKTVEEQKKQIQEWLQAHHDIVKEIESLRLRIQKTNLVTMVSIQLSEKTGVSKSIAAWIHRRKDLAKMEMTAWYGLTNRHLEPRALRTKDNTEVEKIIQVRKYYDQKERDTMVEEYTSEPSKIDAALEITNATTDLIGD